MIYIRVIYSICCVTVLQDVIASGTEKGKAELGVAKYRLVLQDKTYAGEISVALEHPQWGV